MARSFSEDGAAGAFDSSSGGTFDPTAGMQTGGTKVSDPGPSGGSAPSTGTPSSYTDVTSGGGVLSTDTHFQNAPKFTGPNAMKDAMNWGNSMGANIPQADINAFSSGGIFFADGGAVPDDSDGSSAPDQGTMIGGGGDTNGNPGQDEFSQALNSVDQVMQYLYKKYGASQTPSSANNYQGAHQSDNIDDRRDEYGNDGGVGGFIKNNIQGPVQNFLGKASNLYDRATGSNSYRDTTADESNPLSQQAGINDVDKTKGLEGLGDTGESANNEANEAGPAIEEE